jgi:sporulation protein YlmC with PRC-barrel domain
MIRSAELQGVRVTTEGGQRLGHIDEIHIRDGAVETLVCGGKGLLQRFWPSRGGHKVDWSKVRKIGAKDIVVADDFSSRAANPPTRDKSTASAKPGR